MRLSAKTTSLRSIAGRLLVFVIVGAALSGGGLADSGDSPNLFRQMLPVLHHPRCMNCHAATPYPRQGDDGHRHLMGVMRGPDGHGMAGLHCATCHQSANQLGSGTPGAPDWQLAPKRMVWEGLSDHDLCVALQDPQRGGMKPGDWEAHLNTGLVRWAWAPGQDIHGHARTTPPITHDAFLALTKKWLESGAACP